MADSNTETWLQALREADFTPEHTVPPKGEDGEWYGLLSEYADKSFIRVVARPDSDSELRIIGQFQVHPDSDPESTVDELQRMLDEAVEASPQVDSFDSSKQFELTVRREDLEAVTTTLTDIRRHVIGRQPGVDSERDEGEPETREPDASSESTGTSAPASRSDRSGSDFSFESIGAPSDESTGPKSDRQVRIESFDVQPDGDRLVVDLSFQSGDSVPPSVAQLLSRECELRYDLESEQINRNNGQMTFQFGAPDLAEFPADRIETFVDRLARLSRTELTLSEILAPRRRRRFSPRDRSRTESRAPAQSEADDGFVFDFGHTASVNVPREATSKRPDYTPDHLMREDATTPFVDVVLRHPGYSDKKMGQVLSILLEIPYHRALELMDQAPCVIAWNVPRERGKKLKRRLQKAGGRGVLVEPNSL